MKLPGRPTKQQQRKRQLQQQIQITGNKYGKCIQNRDRQSGERTDTQSECHATTTLHE